MYDLFAPPPKQPWKPITLNHKSWPPDYDAVYLWRAETLAKLKADPGMLSAAKKYYALNRDQFILHWMDTYDPRRERRKWIPFVFFERQHELLEWLNSMVARANPGLIEKGRDMGATWICVCWSIAAWLFEDAIAIGWGSRKQELVDKIGDASSIFEKLRMTVDRIPKLFRPEAYDMNFMKLINHDNGATIIGEIGDNIGRGGRTTVYFKDESAHYERPEKVEAALGDTTNVQIDISSVNGPGNVFYRKRKAGVDWPEYETGRTSVFIMDWRQHPAKTQEWYDLRRSRYEREGLLHLFAQEVDRDYFSAVQNTVIEAQWLDSAIDLHLLVPELARGSAMGGLDVADEGLDKNAFVSGVGQVTNFYQTWGERDTGVTARRAVELSRDRGNPVFNLFYDSIGIGAGVKSEYNRLVDDKFVNPEKLRLYPWNAGGPVENQNERLLKLANGEPDPESPFLGDFFHNVKAQAWWHCRNLFRCSWEYRTLGIKHPPEKMLSISRKMGDLKIEELKKELVQAVYKPSSTMKMMIDKKPEGVASPNIADAFVMRYFPIWNAAPEMTIGVQKWR